MTEHFEIAAQPITRKPRSRWLVRVTYRVLSFKCRYCGKRRSSSVQLVKQFHDRETARTYSVLITPSPETDSIPKPDALPRLCRCVNRRLGP